MIINIIGQLPKHTIEIFLPTIDRSRVIIKDWNGNIMPSVLDDELLNVLDVRLKLKDHVEIIFDIK